MSKETTTANGGIGFFGLLAILFIGLKLAGVITWSWWWVLAPIWIPALICTAVLAGILFWLAKETSSGSTKRQKR